VATVTAGGTATFNRAALTLRHGHGSDSRADREHRSAGISRTVNASGAALLSAQADIAGAGRSSATRVTAISATGRST